MADCFRRELNFTGQTLFWRALAHELGVSKMVKKIAKKISLYFFQNSIIKYFIIFFYKIVD
jgi:hypothetical protein